ncbi:MAG TPA: hypothetical protein VFI31_19935 [Pirellulales bacterium]|nr:hypothetical protein [Pirellulales bacterium]
MATVDLTLEQILSAVEQLSPAERKRLRREMTRLESSTSPERPVQRMPRRKAKRMSELLLKANAGPLTSEEDAELNALVDEFESLTLANAEDLARLKSVERKAPSRPRRSAKGQ